MSKCKVFTVAVFLLLTLCSPSWQEQQGEREQRDITSDINPLMLWNDRGAFGSFRRSCNNLFSVGPHVVEATPVVAVGTLAGNGGAGMVQGFRHLAMFRDVRGLVILSDKNYFISKVDGGFDHDDPAAVQLPPPALLVVDGANNCIRIIHLPPAGESYTNAAVQVFAGSGSGQPGDVSNCPGAQARFVGPRGMCWATYRRGWDANDKGVSNTPPEGTFDVFIADTDNKAIKTMNTETTTVSWYAGKPGGIFGFQNGPSATALFRGPWFVVVDVNDLLLIADSFNYVIRSIVPGSESVGTFAGVQGVAGSADGVALSATFKLPYALCVSPTNDVYVSSFSPGIVVRRISNGIVVTVLGSSSSGEGYKEGVGLDARFSRIRGLRMNSLGTDLYISDSDNNRIRVAAVTNETSSSSSAWDWSYSTALYAGNGTQGHNDGDQGTSFHSSVMLYGPADLAFEERYKAKDTTLYFTTFDNYVQMVDLVNRQGPTPTIPLTETRLPTQTRMATQTPPHIPTLPPTNTKVPTHTHVPTPSLTLSHELTRTPEDSESASITPSVSQTPQTETLSISRAPTATYYKRPRLTLTTTPEEDPLPLAAPPVPFFDSFIGRALAFFLAIAILVLLVNVVMRGRRYYLNRIQLKIRRREQDKEDDRAFGRYTNRFLPQADDALEMATRRDTHDAVATAASVGVTGPAIYPPGCAPLVAAPALSEPLLLTPPSLNENVVLLSPLAVLGAANGTGSSSNGSSSGGGGGGVQGAESEQKFYMARNGAMLPYYEEDDDL